MEQEFIVRKYANAFEMVVKEEDTDESCSGWIDIIRQDTDLLKMIIKMVDNKDNEEGRKMAVLLCKHKKDSVRFLADKIMKREPFKVVDRSNITL